MVRTLCRCLLLLALAVPTVVGAAPGGSGDGSDDGVAQDAPEEAPEETPADDPDIERPSTGAPPDPPADVPALPAPSLPPYDEGWQWRRIAPDPGTPVVDAATHPSDGTRIAAATSDGVVWVSRDGGRSWVAVLGQSSQGLGDQSRDEDVLLDVDARLEEILADGDLGDLSELEADDVAATVQDAVDDTTGELITDVESDPGFVVRDTDDDPPAPPRVAWVGDLLFASTGGTLYLSRNDGRTFTEVLEMQVEEVFGFGAVYLALTADGARVALEPRAWFDLLDGTEGVELVDGVVVGDRLLAASPRGLWSTTDGETWGRHGELTVPVRAIAAHPDAPDIVWVITDRGLRRSADRGRTFGPVLQKGRLTDVEVPLPDRVVVARIGTVLQSTDDGASWKVITSGLDSVSEGRLEAGVDGEVLLAAANGLWILRRLAPAAEVESQEWVGLGALLGATLSREGVERSFNVRGRRWTAALTPALRLEYWQQRAQNLDWQEGRGTRTDPERDWRFLVRLIWQPRQSRRVWVSDDPSEAIDAVNLVMVGDEPLLLTGQDDYVVAARLDKNLADYQATLADTVTDLYNTRTELVAERARLRGDRLQRRVFHELAIDEIEARLDALTEGAVLRWESSATLQEL
jgi:photosystem II stability/assembly factor-like uncharacterized protein